MRNCIKIVSIIWITLGYQSLYGQFIQSPLAHASDALVNKSQRILESSDTLSLPFLDDFSQSTYSVESNLWEKGDDIFINPAIGNIPPTINVATFDGWDGTGNPHDPESEVSEIRSDSLVSMPIDLSGLDVRTHNVTLSFFWQQQGFGETPEEEDVFSIEFFSKEGVWVPLELETITASEANRNQPFQQKLIRLTEDYLHEGFQFKFVAIANPNGPFDAWHIDYIKLDSSITGTAEQDITDIAISTYPKSIFNTYTMIPIEHFFAYPDTIMGDDLNFYASRLSNKNGNAISPEYHLFEKNSLETIAYLPPPDQQKDIAINSTGQIEFPGLNFGVFSKFADYDSLYLVSEIALEKDNEDINLTNDTARFEFNIHNTLAYDDGSAEYIAGINQSNGELAVQFFTPVMDTLTHVDIYFPIIHPLPNIGSIQLIVLDDLSDEESSILSVDEFSVSYPDSINEFFRYTLSDPVILPSGVFYISMKQFTNDYISIGLDKNTESATKIFYKIGSEWIQNDAENVSGSLMFRAIFTSANIEEDTVLSTNQHIIPELINIYPNPAHEQVTISGKFDNYILYNLSGKLVLEGKSETMSIKRLPQGVYIMNIRSNGQRMNKRLLISH